MVALVIAEHNNQTLGDTTLPTLGAALQLKQDIDILVIGSGCQSVADEIAQYEGIKEVILIDDAVYQHFLAENIAEVVAKLAPNYSHILAPATTFGKNLMPRVAGLLNTGQISDVTQVLNAATFVRPIYAGNAFATVESLDNIKIITVRTTVFEKPNKSSKSQATIRSEAITIENKQAKFVDKHFTESERPSLTAAKIIVSGGRGLQNSDNFKLLESLASQLGAAIGASRAAVDAGFVPNDYQIGQTGKVVAPDLYLAIGISGAIQHLAGMKDSKVVVAINKDPDAPIFGVCDYGLVADLFKALPELQQALSKIGYPLN